MGSGGGDGDRQAQPLLGKLSESESSYRSSSDEHLLVKRTGTVWTAMAHIITAVIGSGVLALAWSVAQLGWVGGPAAMVFFAGVTAVQCTLITDCYISHDPERGVVRNRSYVDAVRLYLGDKSHLFCGFFLNFSLFGTGVVYTLTSATSMRAIQKANCYHKDAACSVPMAMGGDAYYMLLFGLAQVVLSQIPSFHEMAGLSVFAAVMSFFYSLVGVGLGVAKVIANGVIMGGIGGIPLVSTTQKVWRVSQAVGDIMFAYPKPLVLLDIELGHAEGAGDRDDEEGDESEHRYRHPRLPLLRMLWLRGVRRRHPGQPPHRLRLLRALLAHRPRQPLHRSPPPRRLPGVHAAGVRVRGPQARHRRHGGRRGGGGAAAGAGHAPGERVQAVLPHGVRGGDDGAGGVVPLLQPAHRAARLLHLLAAPVYFPVEMYLTRNKVAPWTNQWLAIHGFSLVCLLISAFASVGSAVGVFGSETS